MNRVRDPPNPTNRKRSDSEKKKKQPVNVSSVGAVTYGRLMALRLRSSGGDAWHAQAPPYRDSRQQDVDIRDEGGG